MKTLHLSVCLALVLAAAACSGTLGDPASGSAPATTAGSEAPASSAKVLSRRIAGRGAAADSSPRQTTFTTTTIREIQTVAASATAEDVAIPAGFKEKK